MTLWIEPSSARRVVDRRALDLLRRDQPGRLVALRAGLELGAADVAHDGPPFNGWNSRR